MKLKKANAELKKHSSSLVLDLLNSLVHIYDAAYRYLEVEKGLLTKAYLEWIHDKLTLKMDTLLLKLIYPALKKKN